jgi:hypothetical protein
LAEEAIHLMVARKLGVGEGWWEREMGSQGPNILFKDMLPIT